MLCTRHLNQIHEALYEQGNEEEQNLYITFLYSLWQRNDFKTQKQYFEFYAYFNDFLEDYLGPNLEDLGFKKLRILVAFFLNISWSEGLMNLK